jgi:predicted transcriptional regulator
MKTKFKILFLSTLILSLGACTDIKESFAVTPTYTTEEKANFNVQEETQLFAVGSYKVNESGSEVAQMKAREQAKESLKKQISTETTNVLNSFFAEIKTKNLNISKTTIEDLSSLVASHLIKEAVETNSWNNEGKEYVALAIDKSRIPEKVKEIFVAHLKNIIEDLNNAVNKVSNEYIELSKPPVKETKKDVTEADQKESTETSKSGVDSPDSNEKPEESTTSENGEPEVYLDDF